jgi:hypothetical protein
MALGHAVVFAALGALAIAFAFALRAGVVAAPLLFLALWRGVPARALTLAAGALLVVGVPLAYLLSRWDDRGGYNTYYAVDHRAGHWVAVAAVCLLALALIRTLSRARGRGAAGPP